MLEVSATFPLKKKKKEKRFCLPSYVCGQESPLDGKARRACASQIYEISACERTG